MCLSLDFLSTSNLEFLGGGQELGKFQEATWGWGKGNLQVGGTPQPGSFRPAGRGSAGDLEGVLKDMDSSQVSGGGDSCGSVFFLTLKELCWWTLPGNRELIPGLWPAHPGASTSWP